MARAKRMKVNEKNKKLPKKFVLTIGVIIISILVLVLIINIFNNYKKSSPKEQEISLDASIIRRLDLSLEDSNFMIKTGDELKLNIKGINTTYNQEEMTLTVEEKVEENTENKETEEQVESQVILYVPEDFRFDEVRIDIENGDVSIDNLETMMLEYRNKEGKTEINKINSDGMCEIESRYGDINIQSGTIYDLHLRLGTSKANINVDLQGNSYIEPGMEELNLNLSGKKDDYKIEVDEVMHMTINGEEIEGNQTYGTGKNEIVIMGIPENLNINFEK